MCREFNQSAELSPDDKANAKRSTGKPKVPAKAKSPVTSQSAAAAKTEEARQISASLLASCLEIFATLANVAPDNSFLTDNSSQLNEILTSCLHFARNREETDLRKKLKGFAVRVLSMDAEASRMDSKVLQRLNVLLERILVTSDNEYKKTPSNPQAAMDPSRHGASRFRPATVDDESGDDGAALFALEVIKEVTAKTASFPQAFSSVLLALLSTIVKRHTTAASTKQKQGGVSYSPPGGASTVRQMHHTPISGILAECSSEVVHQGSSGARASQPRDPFPSTKLREFDESLRSAVIILEILGAGEIAYTFTPLRKTFFQTLSSILDSSNNVQLLIAAVRLVGRWLSLKSGGPLTLKERNNFLWKIASFDFNGLPDVVSQPLADLVSGFVISLLEGKHDVYGDKMGDDAHAPPQRFGDSDGMLIGRSLVACLLTANHSLRGAMQTLYLSRAHVENSGKSTSEVAPSRISRQKPVELLWRLLHSDFEGLGGRSWVVLFVELFLASLWKESSSENVEKAARRNVAHNRRLPALRILGAQDDENDLTVPNPALAIFSDSMLAVKKDMSSGGEQLRTSLARLAHLDPILAQDLFQTLFARAWEHVRSDGVRFKLIAPIESLLSRGYHSQFFQAGIMDDSTRPSYNVIKSFLNGLTQLSPMPVLDIDLLVSLAESYNCWYEVLAILEDQFFVFSTKNLSQSGEALHDKILLAMRHCYRQLGESNVLTSLALISCNLSQTHRAASLAVHGEIDRALETYTGLVELVETSESVTPTEFEMKFIEENWIDLQREQCQTTVISEYANSANNPTLMLESAWKQREWDKVRNLCSSPALVAAVETGEASVKMCETLLAVADGKLSDVENLHAQTAQLCLYRWQLLPAVFNASSAHASLLHFFHRLVEIRESGQIMVETSNHSTGKTLPDLKNLLK